MQPGAPRTIVIAEEAGLFRDGLLALCEGSGRYSVTAATASGEEAWKLVETLQPDLVLVDLQVPLLHSLEIAKKLAEPVSGPRTFKTRCIILTSRTDRKTVLEVLKSGAQAYLLKSASGRQLQDCLDQVMDGGVYVSPGVDVQSLFSQEGRSGGDDPLSRLSAREYQVFCLLVEGVRAKEIAARLQLSPKTVDTYRANLMKKLDIHDVAGLVRFAIQRQILPS
jgi:DNA-binding NarL/FixJ family response regulator